MDDVDLGSRSEFAEERSQLTQIKRINTKEKIATEGEAVEVARMGLVLGYNSSLCLGFVNQSGGQNITHHFGQYVVLSLQISGKL